MECVDLNGEEYEPGIPGTRCPVTADSLRHHHTGEPWMAVWEIHVWLQDEFKILFERDELLGWLGLAGLKVRESEKDAVLVNALRGTKCPVTPMALWEMYVGQKKSAVKIGGDLGVDRGTVGVWLGKSGIARRSLSSCMALRWKDPIERAALVECKKGDKNRHIMREASRVAAWIKTENGIILRTCAACGCGIKVRKSDLKERNFCSRLCRSKSFGHVKRGNQKKSGETLSINSAIHGLICPNCKEPRLVKGVPYGVFRRFKCSLCRRCTSRPIIELGLRLELEAEGLLDDGRIKVPPA